MNSFVYTFCSSTEAKGWYLAKVISLEHDGSAIRKGKQEEAINLRWVPARGNGKWFLPPCELMPSRLSKVNAFTVDLTVISCKEDHCQAFQEVSKCCDDLDQTLKPPKYVSLVYDGKKVDNGKTKNISGATSHCPSSTAQEAGKRFSSEFMKQLDNLDKSHVRGEFKLWIYKRRLVPSFHTSLAVEAIPDSTLRKVQSQAIKKIKKWLGLTSNLSCTQA